MCKFIPVLCSCCGGYSILESHVCDSFRIRQFSSFYGKACPDAGLARYQCLTLGIDVFMIWNTLHSCFRASRQVSSISEILAIRRLFRLLARFRFFSIFVGFRWNSRHRLDLLFVWDSCILFSKSGLFRRWFKVAKSRFSTSNLFTEMPFSQLKLSLSCSCWLLRQGGMFGCIREPCGRWNSISLSLISLPLSPSFKFLFLQANPCGVHHPLGSSTQGQLGEARGSSPRC